MVLQHFLKRHSFEVLQTKLILTSLARPFLVVKIFSHNRAELLWDLRLTFQGAWCGSDKCHWEPMQTQEVGPPWVHHSPLWKRWSLRCRVGRCADRPWHQPLSLMRTRNCFHFQLPPMRSMSLLLASSCWSVPQASCVVQKAWLPFKVEIKEIWHNFSLKKSWKLLHFFPLVTLISFNEIYIPLSFWKVIL